MIDSEQDTKTIFSITDIKERSQSVFQRMPFIKRAYLFGSYARREATHKSDLDFEIEVDGDVGIEFFGLYEFLEDEFHKKVDVITSNEAKMMLCQNIEKEKILLYERQNKDNLQFGSNV